MPRPLNSEPNHGLKLSGLNSALDVIYGVLFSFIINTFTQNYILDFQKNWQKQNGKIKFLVLFMIFLYMLSDYLSVKIFNSKNDYENSKRFIIDLVIAALYYISFVAALNDRVDFIYYSTLIHLFSLFWVWHLLFYKNFNKIYKYYLLITFSTHIVSLFGFSLFSILISRGKINLFYACIFYLVYSGLIEIIQIWQKMKLIIKKGNQPEKIDLLVKESGTIFSRLLIFIFLFIFKKIADLKKRMK